jgi:4-hydroxy-tetrahydrodipicolinate synthase
VLPKETSQTVHLYLDGKVQEAKDLFFKHIELVKGILGADGNPVAIKTALALRGQIAEEVRLPLVPATAETKEVIRKQLAKYDLLSVPAVAGSAR